MATTGLVLLFAVFMFNKNKPQAFVVFVVSFVYLLNMWVSQSVLDRYLNDFLGYYVSQSLFEILVVLILAQKPMIEGVVIMALCLAAVFVNIIGFSAELSGNEIDGAISYTMWILFLSQIIILLNKRVSDALFRAITRPALVRVFCVNYLHIYFKGAK